MKDCCEWLECRRSAAKGFAVVSKEKQMKERELMRMLRQSAWLLVLQLRKNDSVAGVFMENLSIEVPRS